MRVPFIDLRRDSADLDAELEATFSRVLRSGRYVLGEEVEAFESACAAVLAIDHAIGVSSGTDALLVSLMALGIGAGDEVVCPAFGFFATAGAIARLGAKPVFADTCPRCPNVSPRSIEARLGPRTKAIVTVDLFGQPADHAAIGAIAASRGLPVVEDAAQAFGVPGVGSRSALACFSFFPTKNLGALGDAGLVATNDPALAERVRLLRTHGGRPKYNHVEVGGNFRIDALQAALLKVKLDRLERVTTRRRDIARLYGALFTQAGLASPGSSDPSLPIRLPLACGDADGHHQYCIRTTRRDDLRAHLTAASIGTEIYYPSPLHLQPCFAGLGYGRGSLPQAESAAGESLALPIFPGLTTDEIQTVVATVETFFRSLSA